jgi:hypothetical protein
MKTLLLLPLFLLIALMVQAQDFNIPKYKNKEDYSTHQADVLQAIQWLKTHPLDHAQRKQANAYVMKWAEGSPSVKVVLRGYVLSLSEKNPDFLMLWIAGWVEYALENTDSYSEDEANHQAVKTVVEYYMAGHGAKKDNKLDKLVKQHSKGELKEWVAKQS